MGSSTCIDIERLLMPVSDEKPSGENPRADLAPESPYRRLKDLRQQVRQAERRMARGEDPDIDIASHWRTLYENCQELLANQAKDYEVTAWLIEAMLREHGFAGLRDGLRMARELAERFWEQMYPEEDEDDGMALRVAALRGLFGDDVDGTLVAPIGTLPLTNGGEGGAFSYFDYQMAEDLEAVEDPDRRAKRIEQGALTLEAFGTAARSTTPEHFDRLLAEIAAAQQELEQLGTLLDERCPQVAPSVSNVRNILRNCDQTIRFYYEPIESTEGSESERAGVGDGEFSAAGAGVNSEIRSREEAFRILLRVADYFKRTEPHSPLSYALEQSVRWGRLPLPKLWSELIPSETDREQVFKLVGILEEMDSKSD